MIMVGFNLNMFSNIKSCLEVLSEIIDLAEVNISTLSDNIDVLEFELEEKIDSIRDKLDDHINDVDQSS